MTKLTPEILDAIEREAIDHATFFGRDGDSEAIEARKAVSLANVAVGYFDHLEGYLATHACKHVAATCSANEYARRLQRGAELGAIWFASSHNPQWRIAIGAELATDAVKLSACIIEANYLADDDAQARTVIEAICSQVAMTLPSDIALCDCPWGQQS